MADSEIAGILVRMEADLKGLKTDFNAASKIVADASNKMGDAVEGFTDKSGKGMLDFGRVVETTLGVHLAGLATAAAGKIWDLGNAMFQSLVVEGVAAAAEAEAGMARFSAALNQSGKMSAGAADRLEEFATGIQQVTAFEGDAVISSMALLQSIGQLSEQGLKDGTQAALDLSTALGVDLNTAAQMVGKAAAGEVGVFKRYGIAIEEGATSADTFRNALDQINARFGGAAAAAANTYAGATAQLTNNYGDLTEEVGNAIVKNQTVIAVIREVAAVFKDWGDQIKGNQTNINDLVGGGLVGLLDTLAVVVSVTDSVARVGKIAWDTIAFAIQFVSAQAALLLQGPLYGIYKVLGLIDDEAAKTADAIGKGIKETQGWWMDNAKGVADAVSGPTKAGEEMLEALGRMRAAAEAALKDTAAVGDQVSRSMASASVTTKDTAEAAKAAAAEFKKLADEGVKLAQGYAESDPATKYEAELEALRAANEDKRLLGDEYLAATMAATIAHDAAMADMENQKLNDLLARNELLRGADETLYAAEMAANQAKIDAIIKQEGELSNAALKIKADQRKKEEAINAAAVQGAANMFRDIATTARAFGKEGFELMKAAATAEAVINTFKAATAAYAAMVGIPVLGPGLAVAAAAAAVAAGMANVHQIRAQKLATGIDSVPGIGSRDNFPALLTPGERVVPKDTNKDLKSVLPGMAEMPDLLRAMLGRMDRLEHHVVVTIGGKEVLDAVNDQLARGRRLAT